MSAAVIFEEYSAESGGREALRRVSFSVSHGEVAALFGKAGAGKSTIALALCGLQSSQSGVLRVLDRSVGRRSAAVQRGVSVGFQSPSYAPELTAQETLDLQAALWRIPRKKRVGRVAYLAHLLGLEALQRTRARELSYGQRIVLEIARALLPEAPVTALDGLLDTLDPDLRNKLIRHVFEVARGEKRAFLIGTGNSEIAELCDKVILLDAGSVLAQGPPEELRTRVPDEVVVVQSVDNPALRRRISERFRVAVREENGEMRFSLPNGDLAAAEILSEMDAQVSCVKVRPRTLHDVVDSFTEPGPEGGRQ